MAILAQTEKCATIFGVVALTIGISAGLVCFAPTLAKEQIQLSALNGEIDVGNMSRKIRCIMPPTWRRDCSEQI